MVLRYALALLVALLLIGGRTALAQQAVGIGTTAPNTKAALEIVSSDKGLLLPRLSTAQRTAIAAPVPAGLLVYQTDGAQPGFWYYEATAGWKFLNPADNLGNHTATQNLNLGTSQLVGNGGTSGVAVSSAGNVGIGTTSPVGPLHVNGKIPGTAAVDQQLGLSATSGGGGTFAWQSFTAGVSGTMTQLDLQFAAMGATPMQLSLYAGQGTGGTLLSTQAITSTAPNAYQAYTLATPFAVTAGQQYTFLVQRPSGNLYLYLYTNNPYASGISSGPAGWDHVFRTYVAPAIPTTALVVTTPGLVGIGTTTPQATLDVVGSTRLSSLAGGGTRMVTTDNLGNLAAAAVPVDTDAQQLTKSGSTISLTNGGSVTDADNQTITKTGSTISLTNGGSVTDADNQALTKSGSTISLTNGGSVTDADNQALSISGSTISLTNGGSVTVPSSADNLGNHTATTNLNLGANQLVGNGGSTGVAIDNSGNVGIGTTTPQATLHVAGSTRLSSLAGGGTRMVTTDNLGNVAAAAVPVDTDAQQLSISGSTISLTNGGSVTVPDAQQLTKSGSTISLTNGGSVTDADNQTITKTGSTISLTNGGSVTDADNQALSISGNVISLTNGGSVTVPAVADNLGNHTATTNLNLGANKLVGNGGTSGLVVTATGHVGIGTTSPLSTLSLSQVTSVNGTPNQTIGELSFVGFNRPLPSASILVQSPGFDDAGHLILKTSAGASGAQERLRITADGLVGIGTSTPSQALEVAGAAAQNAVSTAPQLRLSRPVNGTKQPNTFELALGSYATGTNSLTRVDFNLGNGATSSPDITALSVQGSGNVGIGTTNPLSRLSISQVASVNNTPNQTIGELTFVGFNRPLPSASILVQSPGFDDAGHLIFKTSIGGPGAEERLRITSSGNVGIGTNDPQATLHVAGSTRLSSLAGGGTRMVTTDNLGNVAAAAVPVDTDAQQLSISGSTISLTNGGSVTVPAGTDNLGNHTATTDLNLGTNALVGTTAVNVGNNLNLGTNQLVGNGGTSGLGISSAGTVGIGGAVGIGTTTPVASAQLEVASTTKGFLPPRMTQSERDLIGSPAPGLTIYNTTSNKLNVWNGTAWTESVSSAAPAPAAPPVTFAYTGGTQTYTVPAGVVSLQVEVVGAQGGGPGGDPPSGGSGRGGRVQATLSVTPGEVLTIMVGGQGGTRATSAGSTPAGFNGGGLGWNAAGGGGGASDIRRGGTALTNRVVVAGGGGGQHYNDPYGLPFGGAGGGLTGANGSGAFSAGGGGTGGSQTSGGYINGALGQGGAGNNPGGGLWGGGGGGGGYYGGGGGYDTGVGGGSTRGGAGGGGSSYTAPGVTSVVHTQGYSTGNGFVVITPGGPFPAPALNGSNIVGIGPANLAGVLPATALGFTPQAGGVVFTDATYLAQSAAQFFWNNTTKRLGVGTVTPLSALSVSQVTSQNATADQIVGELSFVGFNRAAASASIVAQSPSWDDQSHLILKTSSGGAGATERLRITSDGNVGIGTTAPYSRLSNTTSNTIGSDSYGGDPGTLSWAVDQPGYAGQYYNAAGNGDGLLVKINGSTATNNAFDVSKGTQTGAATPLFTVRAGGTVGVGTATPQATLEVNGSTRLGGLAGTGVRMVTADAEGDLSATALPTGDNLGNHTATANLNLGTFSLTGTTAVNVGSNLNLGTFSLTGTTAVNVAANLNLGTSQLVGNGGTSGLQVSAAGNVGIGTTAAQKLEVSGNIAATAPQGVMLSTLDRPLITRGYDAFTSGNYSGAGRWGLFMEPSALTMGVPAIANRQFQWATYNANSTIAATLMTLTQTGDLGIGNPNPGQKLDVAGNVNVASNSPQQLIITSTAPDPTGVVALTVPATNTACNTCSEYLLFNKAGTGTIGNISANLAGNSVLYNTTSDKRVKEHITPTHYGLKDLLRIEVKDYNFIGTSVTNRTTGFLAQDLFHIYPDAVKEGDYGTTVTNQWAVDYGKLTPLLVQAIQDQQKEIEALRAQNAQLQQQTQTQGSRLDQQQAALQTIQEQMARLLGEAPPATQAHK